MYRIEMVNKNYEIVNALEFEFYGEAIDILTAFRRTSEGEKFTILAIRDLDDDTILEIHANDRVN